MAPSRKHRLRWWTLAVVSLTLALAGIDTTIVNLALPSLQADLQASAAALQWVVDSYNLVFAGLLLIMGALADRFGRRLALQSGVALFTVGNLWAGASDAIGPLIAARVLTGVGAALMMPATLSIIVDVFEPRERTKAFAIWSASAGLGIPLGQLVSGLLLESFGWSSVFYVVVPIAALLLAVSWSLVPESRDPHARRLDPLGALLSTTAFAALVYGIIAGPESGWTATDVVAAFGLALLAGTAFVAWELRIREPMLDVRLLRNRALSMGGAATILGFAVLLGAFFILTQYLQIARGYSALQAAGIFTALPVAFMASAVASERAMLRFGVSRVTAVGLLICAAGMAALAGFRMDTGILAILGALVVLGLGIGAVMAPATTAMMAGVPDRNAGVGGAMNEQARLIGIALGVSIFGSIVNTLYSDGMRALVDALPAPQAAMAEDSIGGAALVAANLAGGAEWFPRAAAVFVDAFATASLVGVALALAGAAAVALWMPRHATPAAPPARESEPAA